jgi:hypothetical protein
MTVEDLYKNFCAVCGQTINFEDSGTAVHKDGKLFHWKCWRQSLSPQTEPDKNSK